MRRKRSSPPDWRLKIGVVLPVLGLLGALLSAPRMARANSGNSILETIGISIAVGTVLGASTLPFYKQPGSHLTNIAYGAAAGGAIGAGIFTYGLFRGSSEDDLASGAEYASNSGLPSRTFNSERSLRRSEHFASSEVSFAPSPFIGYYPASIAMPLVSLTW